MTIKKKSEMPTEISIDLTGPDGNAFAMIGYAKRFAKLLEIQSDAIIEDMMSGDYDHLIDVFEKNFGSFCTLYR